MILSLTAAGACLLGLLATAAYLPLATRWRAVDQPNERSAHREPTVSSGGLAVVTALLLGMLVLGVLQRHLIEPEWKPMLLCLVLVCLLGAWDDRRSLPVSLRLSVFLVVSAIMVYLYRPIAGLPAWLAVPGLLSALAITLVVAQAWLFNLYNFMDGLDGLAALECVFAAFSFALLGHLQGAPESFLTLAALIGGVYAGFLYFNWPPAKLFMGDAGSLSAGLLLGWLGLWGWRDGFLPPVQWLLVLSPFLLDTGVTLLRRALRAEPLTQAHNGHYYQRLARAWGSSRRVDLALLGLQILWLLPLALLCAVESASQWTFLVLGLFPQLFLMAKWKGLQ